MHTGLNSIRSWVNGQWSKLPSKTMETETCRRDWNLEYVTISEKSQNRQERTSAEFQTGRAGQDKFGPTFNKNLTPLAESLTKRYLISSESVS